MRRQAHPVAHTPIFPTRGSITRNSETQQNGFYASVDYELMRVIIGQRIAQFAAAISDELHRPAPDAQRVELPELQQVELHRIRATVKPDDGQTSARHIAHFERILCSNAPAQGSLRSVPTPDGTRLSTIT
jgi:hypothetical protein